MTKPGFSSHKTFIVLIAAFMVHNSEEVIMMEAKTAESPVAAFKPLEYKQFIFAVSFLSVAAIVASIYALSTKSKKTFLFISTAVATGLLLNVFIPHVAVAIYTMQYTPGLVTAVLLNLPLSLLLLFKNQPMFKSHRQMIYQIIGGLTIAYGLFALSVVIAKLGF